VKPDWTRAKNGTANSSERFQTAVAEVRRLILDNGGWNLDRHWVDGTARLIVAQLAHVHGFAPTKPEAP
jgi:hypothetical protein